MPSVGPSANQPWWHEAMSIFIEVTGVMVVPIVAGVISGHLLDQRLDTEPVFTLVLTALGIAMAAFLLAPIARRYIAKAEQEARQARAPKPSNHEPNANQHD